MRYYLSFATIQSSLSLKLSEQKLKQKRLRNGILGKFLRKLTSILIEYISKIIKDTKI